MGNDLAILYRAIDSQPALVYDGCTVATSDCAARDFARKPLLWYSSAVPSAPIPDAFATHCRSSAPVVALLLLLLLRRVRNLSSEGALFRLRDRAAAAAAAVAAAAVAVATPVVVVAAATALVAASSREQSSLWP